MSEFTIALPGGHVAVPQLVYSGGSPFVHRQPKPDGINVVKVTKENMKTVVSHVINTLGDLKVEIADDRFSVYKGGYLYFSAKVGQWMVEEYNYRSDRTEFRTAMAHEREKYDLR